MGSRKAATAGGGMLGSVKFVGKVVVFVLSFGMLYPNIFDPGTDDVASREAKVARDAAKKA